MRSKIYWTEKQDAKIIPALRKARTIDEAATALSQQLNRSVSVASLRYRILALKIAATQWLGLDVAMVGWAPPRRVHAQPHQPDQDDGDDEMLPRDYRNARDTERPSSPKIPGDESDSALDQLLRMTKRPQTLEVLCNILDRSPRRVRDLIEAARERGFRVELIGDTVGHRPDSSSVEEKRIEIAQPGDPRMFAVVGDLHAGSKHCMKSQLQDFVSRAYAQGVRTFLQVGDLLDGVYSHSLWEQSHRGFEEQVQEAASIIPRFEGAKWPFILGNHDETLGAANGMDVGAAIVQAFKAAGRDDFIYCGNRGGYVRLLGPGETRGLLIELWHPRDRSNAYAKSYKLQKHVEKYSVGQKPDCVFAGHWHQQMYFTTRGVHAFSTGCFQGGQSSFGKSLGGAPDIGSWIIEYAMTEGGTVRSVKPEWVAYYETETVRSVDLG